MFVDGTDGMNSFLDRFERIAKIQGWESEKWTIIGVRCCQGLLLMFVPACLVLMQ